MSGAFLVMWLAIILLGLALAGFALRMRRVVRGLWARIEDLQKALGHAVARSKGERLELFSEIATLVHGRPLRFVSQSGEDVWLWNRFDRRGDGVYVEVGAFNGVDSSNTYFLEQLGWTGVLVEADPEQAEKCARARPGSRTVHAAATAVAGTIELTRYVDDVYWAGMMSHVGASSEHESRLDAMPGRTETLEVPAMTLDSILQEAGLTKIDVMSIDVEGSEHQVLDGLDLARWRPQVIVIENAYEREGAISLGDRLGNLGYSRVCSIGANDVYESEEAAPAA